MLRSRKAFPTLMRVANGRREPGDSKASDIVTSGATPPVTPCDCGVGLGIVRRDLSGRER